jgi:hypothetical protein
MRNVFQAFDLSGANRLETCRSFDRIGRRINAGHVSSASFLKTYFQSLIMHWFSTDRRAQSSGRFWWNYSRRRF